MHTQNSVSVNNTYCSYGHKNIRIHTQHKSSKLKENYRDAWLQYFLIRNNEYDSQLKYDCCA